MTTDTLQAGATAQPAGETDPAELEGLLPIEEASDETPDTPAKPAEQAGPEDEREDGGEGDAPDAEQDETAAAQLKDDTKVDLPDGRSVSVAELKKTFVTFSEKTQELASVQRQTLSQAREAVAAYAQQQAQEMHLISQRLEQLVAPGFDEAALQRLAFENPAEFYQVKARIDVARDFRSRIEQQAQELMQQAQTQREQALREQQDAHRQLLDAEAQKLADKKWWNDDFRTKAVAYARKHGIPEQIARGVAYAGFVEITRKAMAYDEAMQRTKGGKVLPKPAAVVPGSSPARGQANKQKALSESYETARKSGNYKDIGRFLDQVL